jgi:hypothetical protein
MMKKKSPQETELISGMAALSGVPAPNQTNRTWSF